ncbi:MAG TPA: hypothetical protein VFW40_04580 [Capsulimonadaceae bacterium]|nr:hypothetical protein [Capsulimonadaceae bacterium]
MSLIHLLVVIILVQAGVIALLAFAVVYALINRVQIIHQFYRDRGKYPKLI